MSRAGQTALKHPEQRQASHYPPLDWPVIVMDKQFAARTRTGTHSHDRGQLLLAAHGLMVAATDVGSWFVPAGYALWIPPDLEHDVAMHSDVRIRAAYVRPGEAAQLGRHCRVLKTGDLLKAAMDALASERPLPLLSARAAHLAWLIVDEIRRAEDAAFALPLPQDPPLKRIAQALIAEPGSDGTIDWWCDFAGLSRRSLTRRFRAQTGLSFGDWRRRLRLVTAITRLSEGEPLSRIASSLGYRNLPAFRAMAARFEAVDALKPPHRAGPD